MINVFKKTWDWLLVYGQQGWKWMESIHKILILFDESNILCSKDSNSPKCTHKRFKHAINQPNYSRYITNVVLKWGSIIMNVCLCTHTCNQYALYNALHVEALLGNYLKIWIKCWLVKCEWNVLNIVDLKSSDLTTKIF